jgi:hypothetical protein
MKYAVTYRGIPVASTVINGDIPTSIIYYLSANYYDINGEQTPENFKNAVQRVIEMLPTIHYTKYQLRQEIRTWYAMRSQYEAFLDVWRNVYILPRRVIIEVLF